MILGPTKKNRAAMTEAAFSSALVLGLAGAGHCMGMCGGMALALHNSGQQPFRFALSYHAGRLAGYALIGGILGSLVGLFHFASLTLGLRVLAAILLMAIGLQTMGVWSVSRSLERYGGVLWKLIHPVMASFMPPRHAGHALVLGAFWGFMPCGLVYSALAWSASVADNQLEASLLMLVFGFGTLPAMLGTTVAGQQANRLLRARWVQQTLGTLLVGLGAWSLWWTFQLSSGEHSTHQHGSGVPAQESSTDHGSH